LFLCKFSDIFFVKKYQNQEGILMTAKKSIEARTFNIMQYLNHPTTGETLLTQQTIEEALNKYKTISEWAYIVHDRDIKEDGSIKPPHFHVVIRTSGNATPVSSVSSWFKVPENFVNIPKGVGAFMDCVAYLTHEYHTEKTRYEDAEVHSNFDWKPAVVKHQAKRARQKRYGDTNKINEWIESLTAGAVNLSQLREEDPVAYTRNLPVLERARQVYLRNAPIPDCRINLLITGNAGVGKSLASRALARSFYKDSGLTDREIFFEIGANNATFEGYEGQPVIIWNDARPQTLLNALGSRDNLFNVFDSHPTDRRQNIKYGSIVLNNKYNIINTVVSWDEFLRGLAGEYTSLWDGRIFKSEDVVQSYRRFPAIIPLQPEYYDLLLNNGWLELNGDYREYAAYRRVQGNFGTIRRLLEEAGYKAEVVRALGERYDESIAAPAVQAIREKIESITNSKEVDLSCNEEIDKIIADVISGTPIEDFRGFKYGDTPGDPELKGLI
jgi:DNA polymerase III delta prime subunit